MNFVMSTLRVQFMEAIDAGRYEKAARYLNMMKEFYEFGGPGDAYEMKRFNAVCKFFETEVAPKLKVKA